MNYENGENQQGNLGASRDYQARHRNLDLENFKRPKVSSFPSPDKNRYLDRELAKIKAAKSD